MKVFRIVLIGIACLIALMVIGALVSTIGMSEIKKLPISDADLTKVSDGVYQGQFHKGRWTYDARVTVKSHRIVDVINTNERMGPMKGINAKIAQEIMTKQSPRIDAISGATVNTRAFQKAVENALESAVQK
jgi:uncharacterized protein with FMN-binding domain